MSHPAPPEPSKHRLERLRKGWKYAQLVSEVATPSNLVVFAIALVLLLIGVLGGWQRVRAAEVVIPRAAVGKPVAARPFTITVQDAWTTDTTPKFLLSRPNTRTVLVRGQVVSSHPEPVSAMLVLGSAVRLDLAGCLTTGKPKPAPECGPTERLRSSDLATMADLGSLGDLQPDVPVGFVLAFQQDLKEPAPTQLVVQLLEQTHRRSNLDASMIWADAAPVAELPVPVQKWTETSWGTR